MESILAHYLALWRPLGYLLAFAGIVLEGDMTLFSAAFLTHLGLFEASPMAATSLAAVWIGDLGWYGLGRWLCTRFARVDRLFCRLAGPLDRALKSHPGRAIFVSKFAYGLNHLTLIRAGAGRQPLKVFFGSDLPAGLVWLAAIGGLGYFFGASSQYLKHYLRYSEIGLLVGLVLVLVLRRLISDRLKSHFRSKHQAAGPLPDVPA